jgi:large conductance mechanosensitive channel protein
MARRRVTNQPTTVTTNTGGSVRITPPKTKNRHPQPKISVIVDSGDIADFSHGFVDFLREHAIVGLAVGFVIGTQLQGIVKDLTAGFIAPLFQLLFGGQKLSKETFTLTWHGRAVPFGWGAVVYDIIDFIFIMLTVYVIIRLFSLDKLDKPKK